RRRTPERWAPERIAQPALGRRRHEDADHHLPANEKRRRANHSDDGDAARADPRAPPPAGSGRARPAATQPPSALARVRLPRDTARDQGSPPPRSSARLRIDLDDGGRLTARGDGDAGPPRSANES